MRRPPTARAIHRPRLTRPLTETTGLPLVTLVAPAGYGKTTLLCDWADRDERPFAWVTLDAEDNDPACLHASVALAAERVEPGPFVLVLDDLQALRAPAANAALAMLLEGLPPDVTLALASRDPPPLPVARMRAEGRVVELGPSDLAMDRGEAAAMLDLVGRALDAADVAQLLDSTEGWPAALALAALGSPAGFGGTDRLVADYVRDEILRELPPERLRFVLETSVLETFTGRLCDWVLERGGSAAALVDLCRAGAPDCPRSLGRALSLPPAGGGDAAERAAARRRQTVRRSCTAARATGTATRATTTARCGTRSAPATSLRPES